MLLQPIHRNPPDNLSIHPLICPSYHLSILSFINPSINLSIVPSAHGSIHPSIHQFIPSIHPFINPYKPTHQHKPTFPSTPQTIHPTLDLSNLPLKLANLFI
ncbi:hypothetical protein DPMN_017385 [Dreissena polymorpha]|uniref:Uncharacterized protein n=1 Tax=Dreissena polymorpha TaxID=45954 RepID=A0A9D4NEK8_DREPO|nr:hypothetical protein DPMN_017385 [Dreissena polymorpha]